MGFYKTFVLPVIKERFDLDELPKSTFEDITNEVEVVSEFAYDKEVVFAELYLNNLN